MARVSLVFHNRYCSIMGSPPLMYFRLPYIVKQREISGVAGEHPYVKIEQKTHLML